MKRISFLMLGVCLAGLGCVPPSFWRNEQPPPKMEIKPPPAPPIVTADSVNDKNATDRALALREEMEYDRAHMAKPAAETN